MRAPRTMGVGYIVEGLYRWILAEAQLLGARTGRRGQVSYHATLLSGALCSRLRDMEVGTVEEEVLARQ